MRSKGVFAHVCLRQEVMLPYALAFGVVWIVMLMIWMATGLPLGPGHEQLFIEPI